MAMTFPAYDTYDGVSRSISRRPSLSYGQQMGYSPYDQSGMYGDTMLSPRGAEYPHPSYQIYGPPNTGMALTHHRGPSYDDLNYRDGYYDYEPRRRSVSGGLGYPRHRRHSTVSFSGRTSGYDEYRRPGSLQIKFKRKGSFIAGVSLVEAQGHTRLSANDAYSLHDLHADRRGSIHLRVKWVGYSHLTYEIPLDSYDGRISLQTLARRVARACVHYLQSNLVPLPWDRVELHHLEETSYGVWQPMLSVR